MASEKAAPSARPTSFEGFEAVTLSAGVLEATFVPGAGMAGVSLLHDGEELLDRRGGLEEYRATGAVMGIPLLHPWANRLSGADYELDGRRVHLDDSMPRDDNGLPIHGANGGRLAWAVDRIDGDEHGAHLRASLDSERAPALAAAFPFPHLLTIAVSLTGGALTLRTTVAATGTAPVPIAFGFHPYVRVPGVDRASWDVSLPERRHLELDARGIPTGRGRAESPSRFGLADIAFDDAFDGIADGARFSVAGGGRRLTVTHHDGFPVAQVYAPSDEQFICFEPMTAPVDALRTGRGLRRAGPRAPFSAAFSIAIS
jgi:galactose mutarotase-like enzyme